VGGEKTEAEKGEETEARELSWGSRKGRSYSPRKLLQGRRKGQWFSVHVGPFR